MDPLAFLKTRRLAMIAIRRGDERGMTRLDWLDSRHTFSFGEFYDLKHMGFQSLRVINDDRVAPGTGFGTHGHRDMEIVTYVLSGSLAHRDSTGTGEELRRGDVQRMSAGTGIRHSEYNASKQNPVHFLQIWVVPERTGLTPEYQQQHFGDEEKRGRLQLIASHDGRDGSLTIHQDLELFASTLGPGEKVSHEVRTARHAWIQVADGILTLNGLKLQSGDGAAVSDESLLELSAVEATEFLLFDLA
jgi:redox-sensitive bicupin YhaK (pirin superfamily)